MDSLYVQLKLEILRWFGERKDLMSIKLINKSWYNLFQNHVEMYLITVTLPINSMMKAVFPYTEPPLNRKPLPFGLVADEIIYDVIERSVPVKGFEFFEKFRYKKLIQEYFDYNGTLIFEHKK